MEFRASIDWSGWWPSGLWDVVGVWGSGFQWSLLSGLLDVILVFFLIYRTLLLVRGTRAEPMLLGLGIVVLVYIAAQVLHLPTISWVLGNFLGSVILVIVVLFQEDLRRALIKVGLIPGIGGDTPHALEVSIREISRAAAELSGRRIGALVVLRRDVGLEDYTEHAVKIDATVSHQLLISLFLPTSPLHDGAVVIDGDRVLVAGAVLPLTFSPAISGAYGTRHRAAIGLSEVSDALVVVVSEETGTISLIREGRISRDLDERTLYNALHRLTVSRQQRRLRRRGRSSELIAALSGEDILKGDKAENATEVEPSSTSELDKSSST